MIRARSADAGRFYDRIGIPRELPALEGDAMDDRQTAMTERGERSDETLAAVYADKRFMSGVRRAMQEIEDGGKGTPFGDLKRKSHAR